MSEGLGLDAGARWGATPGPLRPQAAEGQCAVPVLRVALAVPRRQLFDYLAPVGCVHETLQPGVRVRVPFGTRTRVGVVLALSETSEVALGRLRHAEEVIDATPVLSAAAIEQLSWASRYYHHPIGEVVAMALPVAVRRGAPHPPPGERSTAFRLSPLGARADPDALRGAPRRAAMLRLLARHPGGINGEVLTPKGSRSARATLAALIGKGWVVAVPEHKGGEPGPIEVAPRLNAAQAMAVATLCAALDRFEPFLLDGITGSGKTEVYLQVMEEVVKQERQALLLVPEIGLTEQGLQRLRRRFRYPFAVLHSGCADSARHRSWAQACDGSAAIVIGTRSAVWTPLARPGIIIVDEEHDPSYKQQEGFRYSARDLAVVRAQQAGVPAVLASATPSLESLYNVRRGRYRHLRLAERAGNARSPTIEIVDLRGLRMEGPFSEELARCIGDHLERSGQVLLYVNRRGYSPVLLCHQCGWAAACARCEARLVYHQERGTLECHYCGDTQRLADYCGRCHSTDLIRSGYGTERVVEAVVGRFPKVRVLRVDRDSTGRRGAWAEIVRAVESGAAEVLVGTQMLCKGHHFPGVTLVAVIDGDSGLYGVDFRAHERLAQQLVQVAGRAGRGGEPGRVMIQTHAPDHPLLTHLITSGYGAFAAAALQERREARLPPYRALAVLRCDGSSPDAPRDFLVGARRLAETSARDGLEWYGPVAAPMARQAGRYRWQLVASAGRARLQRMLDGWVPALERLKAPRALRWSLDVDPQDLF